MRILHAVKTVDGARWAVDQVRELVARGFDVHVALPTLSGRFLREWEETGATLHAQPMDLPVAVPWRLTFLLEQVRRLVDRVKPDLIHSHFFGTTLVLRIALGRDHAVPRVFQVPGPLHLEHAFFRRWELSSAGANDSWIASSRHVESLYRTAGIAADRIFLSYYGNRLQPPLPRQGRLRENLGIAADSLVVGNINYIYRPKWFLGQTRGLKRHEDVIDALARVCAQRRDVTGLLVGSEWGGGHGYEDRLRRRAAAAGAGRIIMPGHLAPEDVPGAWSDFDLAVHVPSSENCGGVVEPLLAGVPVIAARVGGLPEVVIEGLTGQLVAPGDVAALAAAIEAALDRIEDHRAMAHRGSRLVATMFDVARTAGEVAAIYLCIAGSGPRPQPFDPRAFAESL